MNNIKDPLGGRLAKPRDKGLTMILDKGLGINLLEDILTVGSTYIDFIKFSFGTSMLYDNSVLKQKIQLVKRYNVDVYPGGTLFEIAIYQSKMREYFLKVNQLGFTAVEISNGSICMPDAVRKEAINKAKSLGLKVLTEVGKKDKNKSLTLDQMKKQIYFDLEQNADKIIIEGRESGKNISIYKEDGSTDMSMVEGIIETVEDKKEVIIWEAPLKKQQITLIKKLGNNVNLGNIAADEVLALESLRRGLRGDTFALVLEKSFNQNKSKENKVGA